MNPCLYCVNLYSNKTVSKVFAYKVYKGKNKYGHIPKDDTKIENVPNDETKVPNYETNKPNDETNISTE